MMLFNWLLLKGLEVNNSVCTGILMSTLLNLQRNYPIGLVGFRKENFSAVSTE
jgi:hypothetical protein